MGERNCLASGGPQLRAGRQFARLPIVSFGRLLLRAPFACRLPLGVSRLKQAFIRPRRGAARSLARK